MHLSFQMPIRCTSDIFSHWLLNNKICGLVVILGKILLFFMETLIVSTPGTLMSLSEDNFLQQVSFNKWNQEARVTQ